MNTILHQIIAPIARRLGTSVGAYLTAIGLASDDAQIVVAAIPIVIGVVVDLLHSNLAAARGWK